MNHYDPSNSFNEAGWPRVQENDSPEEVLDVVGAIAYRLRAAEFDARCREFDEHWGESERTNCGMSSQGGAACGGCYECTLAQTLHGVHDFEIWRERAAELIREEAEKIKARRLQGGAP